MFPLLDVVYLGAGIRRARYTTSGRCVPRSWNPTGEVHNVEGPTSPARAQPPLPLANINKTQVSSPSPKPTHITSPVSSPSSELPTPGRCYICVEAVKNMPKGKERAKINRNIKSQLKWNCSFCKRPACLKHRNKINDKERCTKCHIWNHISTLVTFLQMVTNLLLNKGRFKMLC